jgi:hypothetical protein
MAIDLTDVPLSTENVDLGYETDHRKIIKLNRLNRPGLSELDFFGLFTKCSVCELVMACIAFSAHCCEQQTEDDMELTNIE